MNNPGKGLELFNKSKGIEEIEQVAKMAEEERKGLIVRINPKTEQIFQNIDFDYSEIFIETAIFESGKDSNSEFKIGLNERKKYFDRNYNKILIHFFQFLFDFELQVLQFQEKHQTFLNYAQWLQNEVIFQLPNKISFLNKKKNEQKKTLSEQQKNNDFMQKTKRPFEEKVDPEEMKVFQYISSPKKKKLVQRQDDPVCLVESMSKYDESTTNTNFNFTPKLDTLEKQFLSQNKKTGDGLDSNYQYRENISNKKVFQFNHKKISTPQKHLVINSKKKQNYQFKQNMKNFDKKQCEKELTKNDKKQTAIKQIQSKKIQLEQFSKKHVEIVILDSSDEEKDKIPSNPPQQIKQQNLYRDMFEALQISDSKTLASNKSKEIMRHTQKNLPQKRDDKIEQDLEKLTQIISQIKININSDAPKKEDLDKMQTQKRRIHSFRARLSGLFCYSQKRYYIFPDMVGRSGFKCEGKRLNGQSLRLNERNREFGSVNTRKRQ